MAIFSLPASSKPGKQWDPRLCLQESRETSIADDLSLSEELDGQEEYKEAAAATRTVQSMPGVMESQSRAAKSNSAEVAAKSAQGVQDEAQAEQKWQSFMAEHFGECPVEISDHHLLGVSTELMTTSGEC